MLGYCEVALPVPLRTTFTYGVPEELDDLVVPGARVLVPFRHRALVGVVLGRAATPPADTRIKNVAEVLDPLPALPPALVELGRWIANYYLAPPGEAFRSMLPPAVELRVARAWEITETGAAYLRELQALVNPGAGQAEDLALLELCASRGVPVTEAVVRKLPGGRAAAARLLRQRRVVVRELAERRVARTQKIVAWKPLDESVAPQEKGAPGKRAEKEGRVEHTLQERGPLPIALLSKLAGVSRAVIDRLA